MTDQRNKSFTSKGLVSSHYIMFSKTIGREIEKEKIKRERHGKELEKGREIHIERGKYRE